MIQNLEDAIKAGLKGSLCDAILFQETRKISNINLILKATKERRRRTTTTTTIKNPRVSRRGIGRNK